MLRAELILEHSSRSPKFLVHELDPTRLHQFHSNINFFASPPGNLKKPKESDQSKWNEGIREELVAANNQRMNEIAANSEGKTLWMFSDATRNELSRRCAGSWIICDDADARNVLLEGTVSAGRLASVYTGEVRTQLDGIIQIQKQQNRHLLRNVTTFNIIVDSQSSIRAVEKNYIRRMNLAEQHMCHQLLLLGNDGNRKINIGFVFSHLDIAGNEIVDKKANEAIKNHEGTINDRTTIEIGYPTYDTWRALKQHISGLHNNNIIQRSRRQHYNNDECFRIRTLRKIFPYRSPLPPPQSLNLLQHNQPQQQNVVTEKIPLFRDFLVAPKVYRGKTRIDEVRLNYARLGLIPEITGIGEYIDQRYQQQQEHQQQQDIDGTECPFCDSRNALGRNGKTVEHFAHQCQSLELRNLLKCEYGLDINLLEILWKDPDLACKVLKNIVKAARIKMEIKFKNNNNGNNDMTRYFSSLFNLCGRYQRKNLDEDKHKNNTARTSLSSLTSGTPTQTSFCTSSYSTTLSTSFSSFSSSSSSFSRANSEDSLSECSGH